MLESEERWAMCPSSRAQRKHCSPEVLTLCPAARPLAKPWCLRGALVLSFLGQPLLQLLEQLKDRRRTGLCQCEMARTNSGI